MYKNKEELKSEIIKKYQNVGFFRRIFSWRDIIDGIENEINKLEIDTNDQELLKSFEDSTKEIEKLKQQLLDKSKEKDSLTKQLGSMEEQLKTTNTEMLGYTKEIHRIFNSSTGRQGKISELRIKEILISSLGPESEMWIENLPVDKGVVEFAVKIDPASEKWVPIDSKSYIPETNEEGEFIIDSKYISSVKKAGEQIAVKYLGKKNTEFFGILVLPSEEIFVSLFNESNDLFQDLANKRIHITSPSNFIQFTQTIANLNKKLESISASEKIIGEISIVYNHIVSFYNATKEGVDKINIAFDSHMPNISSKLETIKPSIESKKEIKK